MGRETETVLTFVEKIPIAGGFVALPFKIVKLFEPDPLEWRVDVLERDVVELKARLDAHSRWLTELTHQVVGLANGARITLLSQITGELAKEVARIKQRHPDQRMRDEIATNIGIELDKFIADSNVWRWTSIRRVFDPYRDAENVQIRDQAFDHFLVYNALEVYAMGVGALLLALEASTGGGRPSRIRQMDRRRLRRHIDFLSVRNGWDGVDPVTLPEQVMNSISVRFEGAQKYVEAGECHWWTTATNRMLWIQEQVRTYTTAHPGVPRNTMCTIDVVAANWHGQADEEEYESVHGVGAIREFARLIQNFLDHGFVVGQQFPRFASTPTRLGEFVYVVDANGLLLWRRVNPNAAERDTKPWLGPNYIGDGWDKFAAIIPAGGNSIYAMEPDGPVLRYNHIAFNEGEYEWDPPQDVREPFPPFRSVIGGGHGVVYLIQEDGRLFWHRHDGLLGGLGRGSWRESEVGSEWTQFSAVFSVGFGSLYALRPDGVLLWYRHLGFKDGRAEWTHPVQLQIEPVEAVDGFGRDGVFFLRTRGGELLRYEHPGWQNGQPAVMGPTLAASGLADVRVAFGLLERDPDPLH